jgi:hypothetical protein
MDTTIPGLDITTSISFYVALFLLGLSIPLAKIITEYIKDNWF